MRSRISLGLLLGIIVIALVWASFSGPKLVAVRPYQQDKASARSDTGQLLQEPPSADATTARVRFSAPAAPVVKEYSAQTAGKLAAVESKQIQLFSAATSYVDGKHQFVRTASAQFDVKDVYQSALAIEDAVANNSGFVVHNNIASEILRSERFGSGEGKLTQITLFRIRGNLTVRVPSDKTQSFLRAIAEQMEFL